MKADQPGGGEEADNESVRGSKLQHSSLRPFFGKRGAQMCVVGFDSHDAVGHKLGVVGTSHRRDAGDM